jgi:uncharacterized protein
VPRLGVRLSPVPDERALLLELDAEDVGGPAAAIIVAELHLGVETKLHRAGAHVRNGTDELAARVLALAERTGASRLVVAGDLKETVPLTTHQERKDVPRFLSLVSARLDVHVVLGNHDAGLEVLVPKHRDIVLHEAGGVRIGGDAQGGGVGVFHGHAWPSPDLLLADELVAAHTHPAVALVDPLGHAHIEPCWLRAPVDPDVVAAQYPGTARLPRAITLVPPFNPLLAGAAVNVDGLLGPGGRLVALHQARIFLLDGTALGGLEHLPTVPEEWRKRRKPPKSEEL